MSKPTIGMIVGLFVSMSMLAFAPALAGPHTDAMAECLVRSTSDSDRTSLVKWIFTTLSLHPAIKSLSTVSDALRDEMNKTVARLIETLLTESCRSEAQGAIKHEGPDAMRASFQVLGQVAAGSMFSHPDVSDGISEVGRYLNTRRIDGILGVP
jgi:hypothetical protein